METVEQSTVKVGQTVSYYDMANPYEEGIIVEIKKKENNNTFLLFGSKSSMEQITHEAVVIYPGSWHKSYVAMNSIKENEYAGHQLHSDMPIKSQEEVDGIVAEYERMQPILQAEREQSAKEKHEAEEKQKEQFKNEYSYLVQVDQSNHSSYAIGAKNIKIELKKAFPSIKFSVTSEGYSMGCSINISWDNGPSRKEVEKFTNKYQEGWFDGMQDLYNYSDQVWTDVFGGAKYVSCDREITEDVATKIAEGFSEYNGHQFTGDLCDTVDPTEPYRDIGRWWDAVWKFVEDKDLTNFVGVEPVDCDCGQWPKDFFKIKEE